MSFLQYKAYENDLKNRFGHSIVVRIEPIEPADVYYTDGDASNSSCKLIFTGGNTVYLPQIIYNVTNEHRQIIEQWMDYVKSRG